MNNSLKMRSGAEIKLSGYIALDTFTNRTNSHFADKDGNLICKAKCRFGYDCHTDIKFVSIEEFYTNEHGTRSGFWKNHLPLANFITCKNCQKRVGAFLKNYSTPTESTESKTEACTNLVVMQRSEPLKAFLSKLINEFDNGGVTWETRDGAEIMLKAFNGA